MSSTVQFLRILVHSIMKKLTSDQVNYILQQNIKTINLLRVVKNRTSSQEKEYFDAIEGFNFFIKKVLFLVGMKKDNDNIQECKAFILETIVITNGICNLFYLESDLKRYLIEKKRACNIKKRDLKIISREMEQYRDDRDEIQLSIVCANLTNVEKEYLFSRINFSMSEIKMPEREQDKLVLSIKSKIGELQ